MTDSTRMVNERIKVTTTDWMTYIVIDDSTVMQVASKKLVGDKSEKALDYWIGKAVKEHNIWADRNPELVKIPVDA